MKNMTTAEKTISGRRKNIFEDNKIGKIGRVFSVSLLFFVFFALALAIFFSSNPVMSQNIIQTRNVTVTENVYVPDQYDYLEEINLTTHRIEWNVSYLYDRENCTKGNYIAEVGTKCWYLDLINTTLNNLNMSSLALLREINATTYSTNFTATITKKLQGNVLTSFGKNLYVVSGDRNSIDENLTGQDKIYETIIGGEPGKRTYYFYLEQTPLDNLTLELITYPHGSAGTANVSATVNGYTVFNNWTFDRTAGQKILANVSVNYLQIGQNTLVIWDNRSTDFYLDYAIIYTSSAALRFLRATQYNVTNVYDYLTGTVYPYLQGMNDNITKILNDTDWIYNTLNCSETFTINQENYSVCQRLKYLMNWTQFLRDNVTLLQSWVWSSNESIIDHIQGTNDTIHIRLIGMNGTLEDIRLKVGEIRNMTNCTAAEPQDALCEKLDNITYHITVVNSTVNAIRIYVTEINATTHWIWDRFRRKNTEVIAKENMTGRFLSGTLNITIEYNITIPLKSNWSSDDYLPIRWKFWFLRWEATDRYRNQTCVNQNREFKNVEPYCNPLVAQYIGRPTHSYLLNISLRPSLQIGNYTVVREVEIDPEYVWVTHARGPVGSIEVTEDTYDELGGTGVGGVAADKDTIYIDNENNWKEKEAFNSKLPTPYVITLTPKEGINILHGSIKVEISDAYVPEQIKWTKVYDDVIQEGKYDIPLVLNLVQGKEYQLEVTICEGPTFDPMKYECQKEVNNFIA